jgi:hypothetical protein
MRPLTQRQVFCLRAMRSGGCTAGLRNNSRYAVLFHMTDLMEDVLAPTVIERAMSVFENLRDRDHSELVQARKALTPHLFGLIASGQTDEERLLVSALIFLKSLETRARTDKS